MKRRIYLSAFLTVMITGIGLRSYGQQASPQQEKQQHSYYRRTLGVDSLRAVQVQRIQDNYKQALRGLMADTSLNEVVKRQRMHSLVEGKNVQLRKLLSPAQQRKMIPSTERMSSPEEK
ncbi:hypothetical protein [Arcticibacter sp.]|uniref:hypothetical protein n=1 Tax=Arcticibacter sp. TaxID=1872630 RepID=UPI00388D1EC0